MSMSPTRRILPCILFAGVMSLTVSLEHGHAASAVAPDPAIYETLKAFHGHACAGSIFGARLGLAAREALKEAGGTGKFKARYYDLSCPVDGIQVAAGTTYGNAALTVEDRDEHRLILTADGNKRQVEARLTKKAEEAGLRSRDLGKKAKSLPEGSPERKRLEHEVEEIFAWLRTAPTAEIATVTVLSKR
ncbi:fmdE, Molybdenum formylmethanofuran dehydrogenase operon [Geobacter sp. OR-1]|uniref:formylmethanofuran dehydrogenase subunit E family protein n=1 Tax=Geobacter sp. OR-1 TaxID=1266765 RepID=UPI0005443CA1|nr:formylmethanofuran dehydrogenase subunit E family protein [Geobacter sp. OR-1]GAM11318.1 fmdE, Molybdenum formylmethanofuran dehydrogenase operon [Geobacter sp. OR-1]